MKRVAVSCAKKVSFILVIMMFLLGVTSCDFFDADVTGFLEQNTDVVTTNNLDIDERITGDTSSPTATHYIYDTTADYRIDFKLNNRHNKELEPHFTFADGFEYTVENCYSQSSSVKQKDILFQDDVDKGKVTLKFLSEFLVARNITNKDISGTLSLKEIETGRVFIAYTIKLHVNTPPPAVTDTMIQFASDADGVDEYVVCFIIPDLTTYQDGAHCEPHSIDVKVNGASTKGKVYLNPERPDDTALDNNEDDNPAEADEESSAEIPEENQSVSGVESPLVVYSNTSYTTLSNICSAVRPEDLHPLKPTGERFQETVPEGYVALYYRTGVRETETTQNFTVRLEDSDKSYKEDSASNNETILSRPTISVNSNTEYLADETTGYFTINMSHNGKTMDGKSWANVRIEYTVADSEGNVGLEVTSTSDSASFELSEGSYTITAWAAKPGFANSDPVTVENVRIKASSTNIYVSSGTSSPAGNDVSGLGTRAKPYATMAKAFEAINDRNKETANFIIYIDGTLSETVEINELKAGSLSIKIAPSARSAVIDGNDSENIIKLNTEVPVSFEGLTMRNGSSSGVYVNIGASVALSDCIVENCDEYAIYNKGSVELNNCTVRNNDGYAIYDNGRLTLNGNISIAPDASNHNSIYLLQDKTITVGSNFRLSGTIRLVMGSYVKGTIVLSGDSSAISASASSIQLAHDGFVVNTQGKLDVDTAVYVSASGSDTTGDGTSEKPVASVGKALEIIEGCNDSSSAYTIYISGIISENIVLDSDLDDILSSFKISGRSSSGTDVLDGGDNGTVISVSTPASVPITVENLTIRNGNAVGDVMGGGVCAATGSAVTIKDCTVTDCASESYGGGVYVATGATVTINDSTITDNSASQGAGVYTAGTLTLDGEISIPAETNGNNSIYLSGSATITIGNNFSWSGNNACLVLPSYTNGTVILDGVTGTAGGKFALGDPLFSIGTDGKLRSSPDLYVSASGSNSTGNGTSANPYATVTKALDKIQSFNTVANYVIHVSGTISDGVTISSSTLRSGSSLKICGSSSSSDILDATGKNSSVVVVGTTVPVTLEKLKITAGNASETGGGVCAATGSVVTIRDCTITDCASESYGGGVYAASGATVTITDSVITDNNASQSGGGVYNGGTLNICGNVNITDNSKGSGSSERLDNVYLPNGKVITVTGVLTGSSIGVTTQMIPTGVSPVVFTSGYGTNNSGVEPGSFFVGDVYGVSSSDNEAVLVISGGTITPVIGDDVVISCSNTSCEEGTGGLFVFVVMDGNTNITDSVKNTFTFTVNSVGNPVPNNYWSNTANRFTLLSTVPAGIYAVTANVMYNNMSYSYTHYITVR